MTVECIISCARSTSQLVSRDACRADLGATETKSSAGARELSDLRNNGRQIRLDRENEREARLAQRVSINGP